MSDEQARILKANESYLQSADGRRAMIAWLVEDNRSELSRKSLEALPIVELAALFAHHQYLAEVLTHAVNDIDIRLLGRIASQFVATHAIQVERGRSGGSARKRKEGIWQAVLFMLRNHHATSARGAFLYLLHNTNSGQPLRVEGWEVSAISSPHGRLAEDQVCQKNLHTGEIAKIKYLSFVTGYWTMAKRSAT